MTIETYIGVMLGATIGLLIGSVIGYGLFRLAVWLDII